MPAASPFAVTEAAVVLDGVEPTVPVGVTIARLVAGSELVTIEADVATGELMLLPVLVPSVVLCTTAAMVLIVDPAAELRLAVLDTVAAGCGVLVVVKRGMACGDWVASTVSISAQYPLCRPTWPGRQQNNPAASSVLKVAFHRVQDELAQTGVVMNSGVQSESVGQQIFAISSKPST